MDAQVPRGGRLPLARCHLRSGEQGSWFLEGASPRRRAERSRGGRRRAARPGVDSKAGGTMSSGREPFTATLPPGLLLDLSSTPSSSASSSLASSSPTSSSVGGDARPSHEPLWADNPAPPTSAPARPQPAATRARRELVHLRGPGRVAAPAARAAGVLRAHRVEDCEYPPSPFFVAAAPTFHRFLER